MVKKNQACFFFYLFFFASPPLQSQVWEEVRRPFANSKDNSTYLVWHSGLGRIWSRSSLGNGCLAEWNGQRWIPRENGGPFTKSNPTRKWFRGLAYCYEESEDKILGFGGFYWNGSRLVSNTLTIFWKSGKWEILDSQPNPGKTPNRVSQVLAFHRKRKKVVYVGSYYTQSMVPKLDTWEWDGKKWMEMNPAHPPNFPSWSKWAVPHSAAWYPSEGKVALITGDGLFFWDGSDWRKAQSSWTPPPGAGLSSDRRYLYAFGGLPPNSYHESDGFWYWDGKGWHAIPKQKVWPPPRRSPQLVWDARRKRLVLFGGEKRSDPSGPDGDWAMTDLWEWDGKKWERKLSGEVMPWRMGCQLAYDSGRRRMVAWLGRLKNSNVIEPSRTWEWDGLGWTLREPAHQPPTPLDSVWLTYDAARKKTVLFGGLWNAAQYLNQTWEWDGKDWTRLYPAHYPRPRELGMRGYDPKRKVCVLYGGQTTMSWFHDLWEWDGKDWKEVKGAFGPVGIGGKMAWRPASKKLYWFEVAEPGFPNPGQNLWSWDGKTWQRYRTKGFPPYDPKQRVSFHGLWYDEILDRFFVFRVPYDPVTKKSSVELWLLNPGTLSWSMVKTYGEVPPAGAWIGGIHYDPYRREIILVGHFEYRSTWVMHWDDLRAPAEVVLGNKVPFSLQVPGEGGGIYLAFLSKGSIPALPIPGLADLPLTPDALFWASPAVPGFIGLLDGQGQAAFSLQTPRDPIFRSLWLHSAALVLSPTTFLPTYVTRRRSVYLAW